MIGPAFFSFGETLQPMKKSLKRDEAYILLEMHYKSTWLYILSSIYNSEWCQKGRESFVYLKWWI
jgi:hypothetical protein